MGRGRTPAELEAFAMLIAAGKSQIEAWRGAIPHSQANDNTIRKSACMLARRPDVAARIEAIRSGAATAIAETMARDVQIDRTYVLSNLKEVVERCMTRTPILDRSGKPVKVETKQGELAAAYTFDSKGAVAALQLLGRELGMFIERKEVRHGPLAQASDDEIDRELGQLANELATITGKPLKQILKESVRAELAIDITPSDDGDSATLRLVTHDADGGTHRPGGVSE